MLTCTYIQQSMIGTIEINSQEKGKNNRKENYSQVYTTFIFEKRQKKKTRKEKKKIRRNTKGEQDFISIMTYRPED